MVVLCISDLVVLCILKDEGRPNHFSPLNFNGKQCEAEVGLESLYSLETLGIPQASSLQNLCQIKKFKENIKITNGKYQVKLAWNEDLLKKVKSNFEVAKVLAKKVHYNNCKANVDKDYLAVFEDQLKLGISY